MVVCSTVHAEKTLERDFRHGQPWKSSQRKDLSALIAALKRCVKSRDLESGYRLHAEATESGNVSNVYVANTLMSMYAKCGSLDDARLIFDKTPFRDVVSWNIMVLGYAENEDPKDALELFHRMQGDGFRPNSRSYVAALKACSVLARKEFHTQVGGNKFVKLKALEICMAIHSQASTFGCDLDKFVANILVDCYANCGSMEDSDRIFSRIESPTVVSWTALVLGYAENGQPELALSIFSQMQHDDNVEIDALSFVAALKACSGLAAMEKTTKGLIFKVVCLEKTMVIHSEASKRKCDSDLYVASSLVDAYVNCGSMVDAQRVFDRMKQRNVVSWNSLISGYAENGEELIALELFVRMDREDCKPDARTYVAAVKACTNLASKEEHQVDEQSCDKFQDNRGFDSFRKKFPSLEKGVAIHARASSDGLDSNEYVASSLIDMYVKYGALNEARRVFEQLRYPSNSVVCWNALVLGFVENGEPEFALELIGGMILEGSCLPNARTFVAALKACSLVSEDEEVDEAFDGACKVKALEKGMVFHRLARDMVLDTEAFVASSLIEMYAKCGTMDDAWRVFERTPERDIALWTGLLLGYASHGEIELALELLKSVELENTADVVSGLNLCASLGTKEERREMGDCIVKLASLEKGIVFHSKALKAGCREDDFARELLNMYTKCGSMVDARRVFERVLLSSRLDDEDIAPWNWMIQGYGESRQEELGLDLFRQIPLRLLDAQSFVAALKACGSLASLKTGKVIHAFACRLGMEEFLLVGNSLIDFYGKSGSILDACNVFDGMISRDNCKLDCSHGSI